MGLLNMQAAHFIVNSLKCPVSLQHNTKIKAKYLLAYLEVQIYLKQAYFVPFLHQFFFVRKSGKRDWTKLLIFSQSEVAFLQEDSNTINCLFVGLARRRTTPTKQPPNQDHRFLAFCSKGHIQPCRLHLFQPTTTTIK